ncbi:uncharacterized protein PGTG_18360 [Puccinia graminis f. sp. tritici CRL 75-36-700-3]|uniref:Uncharacterized protein n=1 Tax=Puccinia graminis f. sp. tritici (strain CRL 75-36-700-3 / race SCCL) TaxID=418459 RepID=E3L750_PUCGT|nr:uncharacterized protein PGTG_18360 [Puccinia graminis f. sp. tritici CRL 75-36-700-3]EFP92373.2 hypothetical protein PGTG_18360 [Puccinia graminis f. sp. tritici CRL 75-36-700-3]
MAHWSLSKNGQLVATLACVIHAIQWIQGFPTHPHLIPSLAANISPTNWEAADEAITKIGPGPKALLMTYSHGDGIVHIPGSNPFDDQYLVYPMTEIAFHRVPTHKSWYLDDESILVHTEVIPGHAIPVQNSDLALNYDVAQTSHQTLPPKAPPTKLRKEAEPFIPRLSNAVDVRTLRRNKTCEEKAAVKTLYEPIGQQESTNTKELSNAMGRTRKGAAVPTHMTGRTDSVANLSNIHDNMREELPPEAFVACPSDLRLYPPGSSNQGSPTDNFQSKNIGKQRLDDSALTTIEDTPSLSSDKEESSTTEAEEESGTPDLAPKFDNITVLDHRKKNRDNISISGTVRLVQEPTRGARLTKSEAGRKIPLGKDQFSTSTEIQNSDNILSSMEAENICW